MRNCKKCDIEHWCENKNKDLCVMELKKGDKIKFVDSNEPNPYKAEYIATVTEVTKTQNVGFEGWGINGIYVTNVEYCSHRQSEIRR